MGISDWHYEITERGYGDVSGHFVCALCLTPEAIPVLHPMLTDPSPCTFCNASEPTVDFEIFMEKFMLMVGLLHGDTDHEATMIVDGRYIGKTWEGDEIADEYSDLALTNSAAKSFVRSVLSDGGRVWAYRDDLEPPDEAMKFAWAHLSDTVKYRKRYIFLSGADGSRPDELSPRQYLEKLDQIIHNNDLTLRLPKSTEIFRVRAYKGRRDFGLSAQELGSTPADLSQANRMSPAGISMFYSSETLETAIAETTSTETAESATAVAVGRWRTSKEIHLVDLTKDIPQSNLFAAASGTEADLEKHFDASYLRQFAREVAKPIAGVPHIEYVPTQVVTEYLRFTRGGTYDGIRFRSAKNGEINYVLFAGPQYCADPGSTHLSTVVELVDTFDKTL